MKVNIAVQFFRDVPAAIRYRVDRGQLPFEAESTAWFCELASRWFTLVSSRHPVVALSHLDLQQHPTAIRTLYLTARTFRQMKMGVIAYWKPSQAGVISSTTVVYQLQEDLLNDYGYAHLLTAVEEDIMDDFLVMTTKEEGHILAYVGGFLVRAVMRTINSDTCKGALTSDSNATRQKRYREHLASLEKTAEEDHSIKKKLEIALEERRLAMEKRQMERRLTIEERQLAVHILRGLGIFELLSMKLPQEQLLLDFAKLMLQGFIALRLLAKLVAQLRKFLLPFFD
ncbi:hypothetical protein ISCGN_032565 [Ixodes scapularis]